MSPRSVAGFVMLLAACEPDALTTLRDSGVSDPVPEDRPPPAPPPPPAGAPDTGVVVPPPPPGSPDAGCSDWITSEVLEVTTSSHRFEGVAPGADGNGEFVIAGPNGQALAGMVPTDARTGSYAIELPLFCGEQAVTLSWSADGCRIERAIAVRRGGCAPDDLRVSLTWDTLGRDFELHLVRPGGRINDNASDCTWTSCIGEAPDWGVAGDPGDDPHKDVDNVGELGPENIYLSRAANGTYTVLVEHWGLGASDADGRVTIDVRGTVTVIDIVDLPSHFVRIVASIDWPTGQVTPSARVHDCNANWLSGCQDALP